MKKGEEKPRYGDENLSEDEKESGRTRPSLPADGQSGQGQPVEQPYPGAEDRSDKNFERPDEFGDGDRRS